MANLLASIIICVWIFLNLGLAYIGVDKAYQNKIIYIILPALFLIYLCISMVGIGGLITKSSNLGIKAGIGLSVAAIYGCILSLIGAYTWPAIIVILTLGIFYFPYRNFSVENFEIKINFCNFIIILLIISLLMILAVSLYYPTLNIYDDYAGYFSFVKKLNDSGSIGFEPFSERRLASSLDGYFFINGISLFYMPVQFLKAIDSVLGASLVYLFLLSIDRKHFPFFLFCIFISFNWYYADINTLPYYIQIFSFALLCKLLFESKSEDTREYIFKVCFLITLTATIKSSFIPVIAFVVFFSFIYKNMYSKNNKKELLNTYLLIVLISFLFMSPFMIQHYLDTGSLLYPVLGIGGHGGQYGYYYTPYQDKYNLDLTGIKLFYKFIKSEFIHFYPLKIYSLCVLFAVILFFKTKNVKPFFIICGTLFGYLSLMFSLGTGTGAAGRYGEPIVIATILVLSVELLSNISNKMLLKFIKFFLCFIAFYFLTLALLKANNKYINFINYNSIPEGKYSSPIKDNFTSEDNIKLYKDIQSNIPGDFYSIARVTYPFLFNLNQNLLIMDMPGGASPKPGIPINLDSNSVREYLIKNGVHYVIWDYKTRSFYDETSWKCESNSCPPWIDSTVRHIRETGLIFDKFLVSNRVIYENGGIAIIDITKSAN